MSRLTATQRTALADWWQLAVDGGFGGYLANQVTAAAADLARQTGRVFTFATSQAVAALFGYARRMSNAATEAQNADDAEYIQSQHIAIPPWARDQSDMNTYPIWHVTYKFTYIDTFGVQHTEYKTSIFDTQLPATIGALKSAIEDDAQAIAGKYQVSYVSTDLHQVLAVLAMRTVPIHNLRPNETTWTPPVVAVFDTETVSDDDGGTETHELRCWSTRLSVRRDRRKTVTWDDADHGVNSADLGATIAAWSAKHPTLWVYAHNLAFDLTVSQVTTHLAEWGYAVTEFAIDSPSPFVKMSNGRHCVTFCDSFSWLPLRLEDVAHSMGTAKVPLPRQSDSIGDWMERCDTDCDILMNAMLAIMNWWDAGDLGHWSVTGSASGWNVMRHKADVARITINPSPEGIACDRKAIYGGRRGMRYAGHLPGGNYGEIDFTAAYPTIVENLPLPVERMCHFTSLPPGHRWLTSDRHGVIAHVRIRTSVPRWPARAGGRVWYPVGEFWTWLAGPDIASAAALGCLVEVGEGYVHRLARPLRPWAAWCLATSRGDDPAVPGPVRLWAKHCGRAVVGKWAQRKFATIELGPSPSPGWHAEEGWHHSAGVRAVIVDFDGRRWQAAADGEGDNCYPAMLAWVEAYTRVRLGNLIEALPAGSAISWDTDGIIANLSMIDHGELQVAGIAPLTVRVKRTFHRVEMIGPQHMVLDGQRKFAGMPASASKDDNGTYSAMLWPKMVWQMANGSPGAYVRPTQTYRIAATYAPGWVLADGHVVPIVMAVDDDGSNRIRHWPVGVTGGTGMTLAADQNRDLEKYRNG
jgi:hypothetical protein